jgi:hypothetical protein
MSLYIHPENQKLLWNTMNQSSLFRQLQSPMKEQFFKSVIQLFYEKYKNIQLSTDTLKQLNKDTILIMTNKLKEKNNSISSTSHSTSTSFSPSGSSILLNNYMTPTSSTIHPNITISKDVEKGERKDVFSRMFQDRQKEYELMNSKPTIPEVNFKEDLNDEPITGDNMSKLIKQHLKEREIEIGMSYYPPTIVPPLTPNTQPILSNTSNTINVSNVSNIPNIPNTSNVSIQPSSLQSSVTISSTPPVVQPVVHSVPQVTRPVAQDNIENMLQKLTLQMSDFHDLYKNLQKEIQDIKNTIQINMNTYNPTPISVNTTLNTNAKPLSEIISSSFTKESFDNSYTNDMTEKTPIDLLKDEIHNTKDTHDSKDFIPENKIHVEFHEI